MHAKEEGGVASQVDIWVGDKVESRGSEVAMRIWIFSEKEESKK